MRNDIYEAWEEVEKNNIFHKEFVISKTCPNKFYIGISSDGLDINIEFNSSKVEKLRLKEIRGFKIKKQKMDSIDPNKIYLKIEDNSQSPEIFEAFSSTLSSNLEYATSEENTIEAIKESIEEYQNYFKNDNTSLTKQEEQGLFGELTVLNNLIDEKGEESILNWTGPDKNKRDFVFENEAIEVKTTLSQINPYISISNELQLDPHNPTDLMKLNLKVFIMEEIDIGHSIIDIIQEILGKIKSLEIKKIFTAKLLECKIKVDKYIAKYKFKIQKENTYVINEDFPRIDVNSLPHGIFDVQYKLLLEDISKFMEDTKND